ncbi:MAG: ribonuclease H-like domain-containing protein [Anaeromyxobacter sp.]|nr:ribonuclease H-like domain-containing protein [Anaeromyxobacter sp.]
MIRSTFRLTPGVGAWLESRLWDAGVRTWDDLAAAPDATLPLPPRTAARVREAVGRARALLEAGDADGLARLLPRSERWRLYPAFAADACFLDIETDGGDEVTAIGLLDRDGPRVLVSGRDLDEFPRQAARWKLLVTFNGLCFDVPVLQRFFPGWRGTLAHLDLCHLWRRLGHAGGLKLLEHEVGLRRPPGIEGLGGLDAVRLWSAWRRGDAAALRLLVEYNLYDAVHLRTLADLGYNRLVERLRLPAPPLRISEPGDFRFDVTRALQAFDAW